MPIVEGVALDRGVHRGAIGAHELDALAGLHVPRVFAQAGHEHQPAAGDHETVLDGEEVHGEAVQGSDGRWLLKLTRKEGAGFIEASP